MLKRVKERVVTRTVKVNVPKDGDGFDTATLQVTWVIVPNSRAQKHAWDAEFFLECTRNVEGYVDEGDAPIAFSKEMLAQLLDEPYVLSAFQREYITCTAGASRGN